MHTSGLGFAMVHMLEHIVGSEVVMLIEGTVLVPLELSSTAVCIHGRPEVWYSCHETREHMFKYHRDFLELETS